MANVQATHDAPVSDDEDRKLESIVEAAANWHLRVKNDDLTTLERLEYLQWLKESPAHIAEALRMQNLSKLLQDAKLDRPQRDTTRSAQWWRSSATLKLIAAVVAFVLMVVVVVIINIKDFSRSIETHAGEWRELLLPGGSTVHLGPFTNLRYDFSSKERVIQLARGEVMIKVANDPARPFYVNAGLARARTAAAEFAVSREARQVLVTVAEGTVVVSQGNHAHKQSETQSVQVTAGEQAEVTRTGPVTVRQVNVVRELAWVQKILIFNAATVAQAIHEFNRRNRLQIEVTDPVIDAKPVSGSFTATDPDSFAKSVEKSLNLHVVRQGPDRLLLESAVE